MAINQWVIRTATGEFQYGGTYDARAPTSGVNENGMPVPDPAFSVVTLPDDTMPDRRLERYDAAAPSRRRPATAGELTAFDDAQRDVQAGRIDSDLLVQAVAQLDYEERQKLQVKAGQTLLSPAQCRTRVRAIYRALLT